VTQPRWELRVDGGQARRLAAWLDGEDELRGTVRLVSDPPPAGQLGGVVDVIVMALGPGAAAAVLIEGVRAWLRSTTSDLTVRVRRPDGSEVAVRAARIRRISAAEIPVIAGQIATEGAEVTAIDA
jgi:hypothetical protein